MQRYLFLIMLLLGASAQANSQTLSPKVLKKATDYVCGCLKDVPQTASNQEVQQIVEKCFFDMISGVPEVNKIITASKQPDESGRKIGEQVGRNMVAVCPSTMGLLAKAYSGDEPTQTIRGKLLRIDATSIPAMIIQTPDGSEVRCVILGKFKGWEQLSSATQKNVSIDVIESELYSASQNSFVLMKEVTSMIIQ